MLCFRICLKHIEMTEKNIKYPRENDERRLASQSRSDHSDRRISARYLSDFPVNIYIGEGKDAKVYHAVARDVSDGGLLLENVDIPPEESRIRLDFKIPGNSM